MYKCSCGAIFEGYELKYSYEEYGCFPECPECGKGEYEEMDLKEVLSQEFDINEGLRYLLQLDNSEEAIGILKHALQWSAGLSRKEELNMFRGFLVQLFNFRMNNVEWESDAKFAVESLKADCLEDPTHYATFLAGSIKQKAAS